MAQRGRKPISFRRRRRPGKLRLLKPQWIDPYPWIPGTKPEKMIFAALIERRIFFVYQDLLPEMRSGQYPTLDMPSYVPDIVCPAYRVIIDPFGDYHHMLPQAQADDRRKMAIFNALGYVFYYPWASDVERRGAHAILNDIIEFDAPPTSNYNDVDAAHLAKGYRLGPFVGLGASSVAAANKARARPANRRVVVRR